MKAPYVTWQDLQRMPLGVAWSAMGAPNTFSPGSEENRAQLTEICFTATNFALVEVNQELAAGIQSEQLAGPRSHRIGVAPSGEMRFLTTYFPILKVVAGCFNPAGLFPPAYTLIPPGYAYPEEQPFTYGTGLPSASTGGMAAIRMSPGYAGGWYGGSGGTMYTMQYVSGWPHAELTEAIAAGVSEIPVDEILGFAGTTVPIFDGPNTEQVQVASVTPNAPAAWSATSTYNPGVLVTFNDVLYLSLIASGPNLPVGAQQPSTNSSAYWTTPPEPCGPGTLSLLNPTQKPHQNLPVLVTGLPRVVRWACALEAKAQGLEQGLATVSIPGEGGQATSTAEAIEAAHRDAVAALANFRRIY